MKPDKVAPAPQPARPADRSGPAWPMREVSSSRIARLLGWPVVSP